MCQVSNKRMHRKTAKCYRVYINDFSFFKGIARPAIGVKTEASSFEFHAFRSLKDVREWTEIMREYTETHRDKDFDVFECLLEKRLESGLWGDSRRVRTCTGYVLTVVRKVGSGKFNGYQSPWLSPALAIA